MNGRPVRPASLPAVLKSRDRRAARQKDLLARYGGTVVSLTPVAPGPEKSGPQFLRIHELGCTAVRKALLGARIPVLHEEEQGGPAGYEALFAAAADPPEIKKLMVAIEESHPAGRLFDIDVVAAGGVPVGRTDLGLPRRRCLLCGDPAGDCARSRKHPVEELLERIDRILAEKS